MKNIFTLKGYPIPPSTNALYANLPGRGRIKTSAYKVYEQEVQYWCMRNNPALQSARIILNNELTKGIALHLDRRFCFPYEDIITKAGVPKRNDTSNRIKALDDTLSAILGINDCVFWSGSESKEPCHPGQPIGFVDVRFSTISITYEMTMQEVD